MKFIKLTVDKASFTDEKGEKHDYISFKTELMGKEVRLYPSANDKKLVNYLAEEELKRK